MNVDDDIKFNAVQWMIWRCGSRFFIAINNGNDEHICIHMIMTTMELISYNDDDLNLI